MHQSLCTQSTLSYSWDSLWLWAAHRQTLFPIYHFMSLLIIRLQFINSSIRSDRSRRCLTHDTVPRTSTQHFLPSCSNDKSPLLFLEICNMVLALPELWGLPPGLWLQSWCGNFYVNNSAKADENSRHGIKEVLLAKAVLNPFLHCHGAFTRGKTNPL